MGSEPDENFILVKQKSQKIVIKSTENRIIEYKNRHIWDSNHKFLTCNEDYWDLRLLG